jgi:hypothetical protein
MTVRKIGMVAAALLLGTMALNSFGQAQPGGNPPGGPGGPGNAGQPGGGRTRGNFDPAQFRQRMMDQLKTQLGATDDEMKVLQPKLEKVMELQRDASTRMRFSGRTRGGGGFGGAPGGTGAPAGTPDPNASPVRKASEDLRTTLANTSASPEDIKAKLDTYRAAKAEAKTQLTAAQQDLRGLLTQRQEAVLVENGLLE